MAGTDGPGRRVILAPMVPEDHLFPIWMVRGTIDCMTGLLCMGRNRAGSNVAVHIDFFFFFLSLSNFSVLIDHICVVTSLTA